MNACGKLSPNRTTHPASLVFVAMWWMLTMGATALAKDTDRTQARRSGAMLVTVHGINGSPVSGTLSSMDEMSIAVITSEGGKRSWSIRDIMWVDIDDGGTVETYPLVMLTNDDVLCGQVAAIDEDDITLAWSGTDPSTSLQIPVEYVRSIVFRRPENRMPNSRTQRPWALLEVNQDRLIAADSTYVDGELVGLSEQKVQLRTSLGIVSIPVDHSFSLILNTELSSTPPVEGSYTVTTLVDGSRVTWDSVPLAENGQILGKTIWGVSMAVPLELLVRMQFLGDRSIALADLKPSDYVFTPYLSETHPLIPNRNIRGGPLRLRGQTSATGLGVSSKSEVTFDLTDGNYQRFRSDMGVDDVTGGDGSVVFSIEVDGRRVYKSPALNGRSPIESVEEIDLVGAKSLKLIVDFGEFANICDVADWSNAVLIRPSD